VVRSTAAATTKRVPSTASSPWAVSTVNVPCPGAISSKTSPSTTTRRAPLAVSLPPGPSRAVEPSASRISPSSTGGGATAAGGVGAASSPATWATTTALAAAAIRPQPTSATRERSRATRPWRATRRCRMRARALGSGPVGSEPARSVVRFCSSMSSSRSVMAAPR
jgi:hypothetical protein